MSTTPPYTFEWAVAASPMEGEALSGDLHLVKQQGTTALLAVVDALGHGPEAAAVAQRAVAALERTDVLSADRGLAVCHEALKGTRGAALAVVLLDASREQASWLSVGNVEALLLHADAGQAPARRSIRQRGGIVGQMMPPIVSECVEWRADDLLIIATDGVRTAFAREQWSSASAAFLAQRLFSAHSGVETETTR